MKINHSIIFALLVLINPTFMHSNALAGEAQKSRANVDNLTPIRVIMLMRHGVRAPINGEVPLGTKSGEKWSTWSVPEENLTPNGAAAIRRIAQFDRDFLVSEKLLSNFSCPSIDSIRIRTNNAQRTVATGDVFIDGFAKDCGLVTEKIGKNTVDPLFEPLNSNAIDFDAHEAVKSINSYIGNATVQVDKYRTEINLLDKILNCGDINSCSPNKIADVKVSSNGRGVDFSGLIRETSGTAQVLLLQYIEGFESWPGVDEGSLKELGKLHAALFDVFTRPEYMRARQAAPLGHHILNNLSKEDAPIFELLVGHDTNVTALGALLDAKLIADGYADGDVPPGGAIMIELLRNKNGKEFVRLFYQTQRPSEMRKQSDKISLVPLKLGWCSQTCPIETFKTYLSSRMVRVHGDNIY